MLAVAQRLQGDALVVSGCDTSSSPSLAQRAAWSLRAQQAHVLTAWRGLSGSIDLHLQHYGGCVRCLQVGEAIQETAVGVVNAHIGQYNAVVLHAALDRSRGAAPLRLICHWLNFRQPVVMCRSCMRSGCAAATLHRASTACSRDFARSAVVTHRHDVPRVTPEVP